MVRCDTRSDMNRGLALWASLAVLLALFVTGSVVAVFPLGESRIVQPPSIPLTLQAPSSAPVPVSFPASVVGTVTHSSPTRGGQAATGANLSDVSIRLQKATARTQSRSNASPQTLTMASKKAPKRPASIGGVSGGSSSGDAGLSTAGSQTQPAGGSRDARPPR
jgi:hypothetical protein